MGSLNVATGKAHYLRNNYGQLEGAIFFLNCFAPIFLATVIFIRRIFYPTLFGSDFFGHSHFYKVPFFSTVWLRFFGNSHFINCIVLSCTVAQFFFAAVIFIGCHFFVFNCLVPIFLVTVIFIRRFFSYAV